MQSAIPEVLRQPYHVIYSLYLQYILREYIVGALSSPYPSGTFWRYPCAYTYSLGQYTVPVAPLRQFLLLSYSVRHLPVRVSGLSQERFPGSP